MDAKKMIIVIQKVPETTAWFVLASVLKIVRIPNLNVLFLMIPSLIVLSSQNVYQSKIRTTDTNVPISNVHCIAKKTRSYVKGKKIGMGVKQKTNVYQGTQTIQGICVLVFVQ